MYAKKRISVSEDLVEQSLEIYELFFGKRNALAHFLTVGRPLSYIVFGLFLIPADELDFFLPTLAGLRKAAVSLDYFVIEFFCYKTIPPFATATL